MPASDPLEISFAHDHWATRQMLLACEKLTPAQFAQKFDMGPGSLQATITHMISAMRAWTDTLMERPQQPRLDQTGAILSPGELLRLLDQSAGEFKTAARTKSFDRVLKRTREGKDYFFTRGAIVMQVVTHGMHHRAQCLNMLRQLGVSPLPLSSVIEWVRMADGA